MCNFHTCLALSVYFSGLKVIHRKTVHVSLQVISHWRRGKSWCQNAGENVRVYDLHRTVQSLGVKSRPDAMLMAMIIIGM